SEVGRMNSIDVAQEDLNKALIEEMRRYPGQEKEVLNFYQSNPEAMNRLRAPVYEDKVVDYIIELADVSESETTVDALVADPEDDATTTS
ncbi:MAG: trigger factor, partial [Pseudomonadota bacterium]